MFYSSLSFVEGPIGRDAYLLPSCSIAHFRLLFELSMNKSHSSAQYRGDPIFSRSRSMSLQ